MKQADIARALDVNVSTIRRWASGNSTPSDDHVEQLRQLCGPSRSLGAFDARKSVDVDLSAVSSSALIEELARRARGGTLRDGVPVTLSD